MIRRIKELDPQALIASEKFKDFVVKQETQINRGISLLCVLSILAQNPELHAYKLLKNLREKTNDLLIIEEGSIYPMLKKLELDGIVHSKTQKKDKRNRRVYTLTEFGKKIYNHLAGFYSKLSEAVLPLFDAKAVLDPKKFIYCPLCANKIDVGNTTMRFCDVCGNNIEKELQERGIKYE